MKQVMYTDPLLIDRMVSILHVCSESATPLSSVGTERDLARKLWVLATFVFQVGVSGLLVHVDFRTGRAGEETT